MKAAKIIYIMMNIVMVCAAAGLAVYKMLGGFNALYLIAPAVSLVLFLFMRPKKGRGELKQLMKIVFSSHVAVMIVITQAVFVFEVTKTSAIVILNIAAVLIASMVWALCRMFKKISVPGTAADNEETQTKDDE